MDIKVEVNGRETIKPSSPTPQHLSTHKLSAMDQFAPGCYITVVFFYASSTSNNVTSTTGHGESQRLKKSLSEALSVFYPLAGRLSADNVSVDCNDEGADYFEARVINCSLSEILEQPKVEDMVRFFPTEPADIYKAPLLVVQANFFPCGGVAIAVRLCHKVADAAAFLIFINGWSSAALGSGSTTPAVNPMVPDFSTGATLFPPIVDTPAMPMVIPQSSQKLITKRFVVDASKITSLKAKAAGGSVKHPTRVESVTALLWNCAVAASKKRSYLVMGAVNLRTRLMPPLPGHSFGNILGILCAVFDDEHEITDLSAYVSLLRKGVEESARESLSDKMAKMMAKGDDIERYSQSSWCRFPLYEADFGWGKPTWVSVSPLGAPVGFLLTDARDGEGIEAWVTLNQDDMALFEGNKELLTFASPNPSPL